MPPLLALTPVSAAYTGTIVGHDGGFQARLRVPADFAYAIPEGAF